MCEGDDQGIGQIAINQEPVKEIIIKFPNDIEQLTKTLDWIYNSKHIMTIRLTQKIIDDAGRAGCIIEERKDD